MVYWVEADISLNLQVSCVPPRTIESKLFLHSFEID